MDYVKPEFYKGIKMDSEVNYYFLRSYRPPDELKEFFFSEDKVMDLKYTKIKINSPSKYLTEDLWIEVGVPLKVSIIDFVNRYAWIWGLVFFIVCSMLASLAAGKIMFRDLFLSVRGYLLYGLFNFLTIIGFGINTYFMNTKKLAKNIKDYMYKNGLNLVKSPKERYTIYLVVFLIVILLYMALGRIDQDMLLVLLFPVVLITLSVLIFKLSREEIKENAVAYLNKNNISLMITDAKKFGFLLIGNILGSFLAFRVIFSRYDVARKIAEALGFVRTYGGGRTYPLEQNLPLLIILVVFTLSIALLFLLDKLFKDYLGTKGWIVVHKDNRKYGYVALFSFMFFVIATIGFFVLKFLI